MQTDRSEFIATYHDPADARIAINRLEERGVSPKDISLVMADDVGNKNFKLESKTKAPEGIATGAGVGGGLGALAAGLTAVGTITLTGGMGILAAGPVVAALAGAGAGAAAGGLLGGLIGAGMTENEAKLAETKLKDGSVLLGVTVDKDRKNEVKAILEASQADHIS